jgi:hypothetical protein
MANEKGLGSREGSSRRVLSSSPYVDLVRRLVWPGHSYMLLFCPNLASARTEPERAVFNRYAVTQTTLTPTSASLLGQGPTSALPAALDPTPVLQVPVRTVCV